MIVGFTGASGTGKSWAAGKLAALLGSDYIGSCAAEVAETMGFDVNAPHTFAERLEYQRNILEFMNDSYSMYPTAVFDRTPIDLMAYVIIAANDEVDTQEYRDYLDACMDITDKMVDVIVLVSPPYEQLIGDCEYKPGRLIAEVHGYNHRALFDATVKILLTHPKLRDKVLVIPEDCHYDDRVSFVMDRIDEYRTSSPDHGSLPHKP